MNKTELKAFEKMIDKAAREAILDLYIKALDECNDIYYAMLKKLRENIDYELSKRKNEKES